MSREQGACPSHHLCTPAPPSAGTQQEGLPQRWGHVGTGAGRGVRPAGGARCRARKGCGTPTQAGRLHLTGDHETAEPPEEGTPVPSLPRGPARHHPPVEGPPTRGLPPRPLPQPHSPAGACSSPCTRWKVRWVSGVGPPQNVRSITPFGLEVHAPAPGCPQPPQRPRASQAAPCKPWTASLPQPPAPSPGPCPGLRAVREEEAAVLAP